MNFMYLKNLVIVVTIINFNVLNYEKRKKTKFHFMFTLIFLRLYRQLFSGNKINLRNNSVELFKSKILPL